MRQWPAENVHLYCLLHVRTTSSGAVFERAPVAQPEIGGEGKWCSRKALMQSPNVCTAADADNTLRPKRLRAHQRLHQRPVSRARARLKVYSWRSTFLFLVVRNYVSNKSSYTVYINGLMFEILVVALLILCSAKISFELSVLQKRYL